MKWATSFFTSKFSSFRDSPLDGGRRDRKRAVEEWEADIFASMLLMPKNFIREEFLKHFGVETLATAPIDEHLASILGFGTGRVLKASELRTTRDISRWTARCLSLNMLGSKSLAGKFDVSVDAMAIRLEELNLVPRREPTTYDVFISYSRRDAEIIQGLVEALRERGLNPWFDRLLVPGGRWADEVVAAVKKSRTAAIFLGSQGCKGFQQAEVDLILNEFIKSGRRIIPVFILGWNDKMRKPHLLSSYQWVDFRDPNNDPLDQLIQGIVRGMSKKA